MYQDSPGREFTWHIPRRHSPQRIRNLYRVDRQSQALFEHTCIDLPRPEGQRTMRERSSCLKQLARDGVSIRRDNRANNCLTGGPFDLKLPLSLRIRGTLERHRMRTDIGHGKRIHRGIIVDYLKNSIGEVEPDAANYPSCKHEEGEQGD